MISKELKNIDTFGKGRLEKILNLDFMSEELLNELVEHFPPYKGKWNGNVKDLTGVYQENILKVNPKYAHLTGHLVALYMLEDQRQKGHKSWLAWNLKTNDVYGNVTAYNFTIGHVTGAKPKAGESYAALHKPRFSHRVDLTGKEFGYLRVIEETGNRQVGDARIEWKCKCLACGKIINLDSHTLAKGEKVHCGCQNPYSNEVVLIRKLLDENNIKYKQEYTFNDCRDINPLPFDFVIEDDNGKAYLLEYDGEQHFKSVTHWGGLETVRKHDLIKNNYCFKNNIRLIRIPYDIKYTINDLKPKTTKFLLTSENEEKYYESRK